MSGVGFETNGQAIAHEAALLLDAMDAGPLDVTVPTCPEWTMTKLVVHVGRAHRWAAELVSTGATEFLAFDSVPDIKPVRDAASLRPWLLAGANRLHGVLAEKGPDAPTWTWAGMGTSAFWARRMAQETLVHRMDAQLTRGGPRALTSAEPVLHADGIDEGLDMLIAVAPPEKLAGSGQTIHVHAEHVGEPDEALGDGGEWLITRGASGASWTHGHATGDVALRGPVHLLQAVLARRLPTEDDRVEVLGDGAVLDDWLRRVRL